MKVGRLLQVVCLAMLVGAAAGAARAQANDNLMSDVEVEHLRDAAYVPVDRVDAFVKILDGRTSRIVTLATGKRRPGREQNLHELFDQFTGIAEELNDNVDEYGQKRRDIRKALPKLLEATERWGTALRTAPDAPEYKVVKQLALDALHDLHESAATLTAEQAAFFKAHPEAAKADAERSNPKPANHEPVDIPR